MRTTNSFWGLPPSSFTSSVCCGGRREAPFNFVPWRNRLSSPCNLRTCPLGLRMLARLHAGSWSYHCGQSGLVVLSQLHILGWLSISSQMHSGGMGEGWVSCWQSVHSRRRSQSWVLGREPINVPAVAYLYRHDVLLRCQSLIHLLKGLYSSICLLPEELKIQKWSWLDHCSWRACSPKRRLFSTALKDAQQRWCLPWILKDVSFS